MKRLSKRQEFIFKLIEERGLAGNQEILKELTKAESLSRQTLFRELRSLLRQGWIIQEGKGRGVIYRATLATPLLTYIDAEKYFKKGPDERILTYTHFNWDIFDHLLPLFSAEDLKKLNQVNTVYRKNVQMLSPSVLRKEWERLSIELSWKSSQIEGNTYSLIDTEILLKEHKEAKGHTHEEAQMILNHKEPLNLIFDNPQYFRTISVQKLEEIHKLLLKNLDVAYGLRKRIVGITGTLFKPLDNQHQIREALEKTAKAINGCEDPFSKALIAVLTISYIQPFEDGNKRSARMIGNALLYSHHACPLSYRSVDEAEYKKAIVLFYEQNSARYFKELFMEQFEFAVKQYFLS